VYSVSVVRRREKYVSETFQLATSVLPPKKEKKGRKLQLVVLCRAVKSQKGMTGGIEKA
jgi:hypothetical protein